MLLLLPSCEEIPPEALPASDTISSLKSDMPASEPFISKGTIEHSSNCEFLLKIYHFLSFWKSLSSTKLAYTPNALRSDLRTNLTLRPRPHCTVFKRKRYYFVPFSKRFASTLIIFVSFSYRFRPSILQRVSVLKTLLNLIFSYNLPLDSFTIAFLTAN